MSRAQQLADALLLLARANHYMLGIKEKITRAELDDAEQLLITAQNALPFAEAAWKRHELALDILAQMKKETTS